MSTVAAAVALAAGVADVHAATVTIKFDNPIFNGTAAPAYDAVKLTAPAAGGSGSITLNNVAAGRFQGTAIAFSGVPASIFVDGPNDVYMYCYDIHDTISGGQTVTYSIHFDHVLERTLDFLGAVNQVLSGTGPLDPYAWLRPVNGLQAAAIQLGIWESKYDDVGWDLASGAFRATQIETGTQGWLNQFFTAMSAAPSLGSSHVMTFEAAGAQDMITGDPPAVPLPGTLALLAAAALAWPRRRRGSHAAA